MEIIERYFEHHDARGSIEGLVNFGTWREINLITSQAGTVRGHHYHKSTEELFIILDGEIDVIIQDVNGDRLTGTPVTRTALPGDVFVVHPNQYHVFSLRKDSRWINALSTSLNAGSPDIHRIEEKNERT